MIEYVCPECGWNDATAKKTNRKIYCLICDTQMNQEDRIENITQKKTSDNKD